MTESTTVLIAEIADLRAELARTKEQGNLALTEALCKMNAERTRAEKAESLLAKCREALVTAEKYINDKNVGKYCSELGEIREALALIDGEKI